MESNLYKSALLNLSNIPEKHLKQVNAFLSSLAEKTEHKSQNRKEILSLAGSWSDMNDEDFNDYLKAAKESGKSLFDREIEL